MRADDLPLKEVARRIARKGQIVAVLRLGEHRRDERMADGSAVKRHTVVKAERHILVLFAPVLKDPAERNLGVRFLCRVVQRFVHLRLNPVVAVAKADIIAPRRVDARVSRRRYALIFFKGDDTDAAVHLFRAAQNLQRVIRTAVADKDELDIPQRLRTQG